MTCQAYISKARQEANYCRYQVLLARKQAAEEMKQVMRDLAKTAKLYTVKLAASTKLQVGAAQSSTLLSYCIGALKISPLPLFAPMQSAKGPLH